MHAAAVALVVGVFGMMLWLSNREEATLQELWPDYVRQAVKSERERCARIAEAHAEYWSKRMSDGAAHRTNEAEMIAFEIRNSRA